ncbi:DUF2922 domain-containing protein [Sporomusa sphaeroides]|uniref:DUF2922 domain-containing protein n=2 Tax=Sporomusa TaxID=2375 RepID=A0ABM9W7C4_9FIRM|nr:DUF2922 domain-containing protein [Sporomusa sphaeroides]OLS55555.1 hypothetical protein SPSPH_36030 [Sporomusa sphaeroides DSM 2875]CVK19908.1 hypothetical protein SSPH_02575 [Sporomusa sphaeroides DSM 2875]SCM83647.1 conserved hypothetical protein [uncultured Sporomusa sp.]
MTKTLQMVFLNSAGKETVISVADPKDDLTLAQVQAVMQDIIDKNIFVVKGNTLAGQVEARISNRETVALV